MQPEFMDKVLEVAKRVSIAYLATCAGDQPAIRPVQPAWDGMDLWVASRRKAPKVRQIEKNPKVQLFYQIDKNYDHLTVSGEAEIVEDPAAKRKVWTMFDWSPGDYYSGPDDPNYGLIKIKVNRIELGGLGGEHDGRQRMVWKRS